MLNSFSQTKFNHKTELHHKQLAWDGRKDLLEFLHIADTSMQNDKLLHQQLYTNNPANPSRLISRL